MKINSIKIDQLFEIFDYNISFTGKENLLIITGPNGFGKTMILNIIFSLFNRKFSFFTKLVFERINICLDNNTSIVISKKGEHDKLNVEFNFLQNDKIIYTFKYSSKLERQIERAIQTYLPISKIDVEKWVDLRNNKILTIDDIFNEYADKLPEELRKDISIIRSRKINEFLDSIKVHFIREQRLFKEVANDKRDFRDGQVETIMTETIQSYADELKQLISLNSQQSFKMSQELDSSYPNRLISEKETVSEGDYNLRFNELKEKQEKLKNYGLYESEIDVLGYSESDSKALLVYLNDFKRKLSMFDELLEKLELFANILNERRFTHKSIEIDREKGFYFKTINGKELELTQLSSGEQHEVVLLYELIFKAKQNVLVLIDEPEISLHITWQKEFLNDLLRIIKLQNIQVIIATHSSPIINDRWDLVYNLEKVEA